MKRLAVAALLLIATAPSAVSQSIWNTPIASYEFTASGTLIVPPSKFLAKINACSGGGGGNQSGGGTAGGGGGGGGGAGVVDFPLIVTPGQTLTVTVGAAGVAGNPATAGGQTSVSGTNIFFLTLAGGGAGTNQGSGSGGTGGAGGSPGTAGAAAGQNATAIVSTNTLGPVIGGGGGGGGGSGSAPNGGAGGASLYPGGAGATGNQGGGAGGGSPFGPGAASTDNNSGTAPPYGFCGGGSGGGGTGSAGGNGAPGFLSITFP